MSSQGGSGTRPLDREQMLKNVRIAALGDLHYTKSSQGTWQPLFSQISDAADVFVLCGDLTDYGLADEARGLVKELTAAIRIPIVAVLGNHDYEAGQEAEIRHILTETGRHDPRWGHGGSPGHRICGCKGLCGRIRTRNARPMGRAGNEGLRAGSRQ